MYKGNSLLVLGSLLFLLSVPFLTFAQLDTGAAPTMTEPTMEEPAPPEAPIEEPPTISSVTVSNITHESARIDVESDKLVVAYLEYGTDASYGMTTPLTAEYSASPSFELTLLLSQTTYHFRVIAMNASGSAVVTTDQTFTTLAAPVSEPLVSEEESSAGTSTEETVTTEPPAQTEPTTSTTTATTTPSTSVSQPPVTPVAPSNPPKQTVVKSSSAVSVNGGGGFPIGPFRPLILKVTPGDGKISFTWRAASANTKGTTIILRKEGNAPVRSRIDGTVVFEGAGNSFTDTSVTNGKEYHYAMYIKGELLGRHSPPAKFKAVPTAKSPAHAVVSSSSIVTPKSPTEFTRNLFQGLSGVDVSRLQQFLIDEDVYPESLVTGYFGSLTKAAVIRFQMHNGITPSVGYFGSLSRAQSESIITNTFTK